MGRPEGTSAEDRGKRTGAPSTEKGQNVTNETYWRCQFLLEIPPIESKADRAARWNEISDYLLSHKEYEQLNPT